MRFHVLISQLSRILFTLSLVPMISGIDSSSMVQAQDQNPVNLVQFDMLTINSGWILLDQHLFWTSDVGQTWREIGPSISSTAVVQDVQFKDFNTGWMIWSTINSDGSGGVQLASTTNHGVTWTIHSLSLFEPGEIVANAEKAEMGWFDVQRGWISIKQNTGSNFSIGFLFTTSDGGNTWSRSALPSADKIYFGDPQIGWAVGGPTNNQLFETENAGANWKKIKPDNVPHDTQAVTYPPFSSDGRSLLVITNTGSENGLKAYTLENSSTQWLPVSQIKLDIQLGSIGLSILDTQNFVATVPGTRVIVRMINGELSTTENKDGLSAAIVELDMTSQDIGWAKSIDSSCITASLSDRGTAIVSCSANTRLLQTTNGGVTWQILNLPAVRFDIAPLDVVGNNNSMVMSTASVTDNTEAFVGQGFDICEIPTLSQMQTWSNSSPYRAVNLYIGGSSHACENSALTSSYLFQLNQQGWRFIPTWVGPQAPCTGYISRMSSDAITAYEQGVSEANLAVESLAALGLTNPDKTGSVVYYDIEYYGTDTICRTAVNSFMNGWVSQIHARGSLVGVYGSTLCNTGLSDFLAITNMPDVIWPARWYHSLGSGYYDPTANVWDLGSCIPNTVWSNHQRIRQYEGDHSETWGGLTMAIDSDVLDGIVAIPHDYPFVSSIVRANSNPTNAATVSFTVSFSKSVTGVDKADFELATNGIADASISSVSGSGATYSVTINTGSSSGTIRLDVVDDDSIQEAVNNPLGGAGTGNGNYTSGETYKVIKSAQLDTTGVFRPSNGLLYLKNKNETGFADIEINYGLGGDYPVVGDWDGNGTVTIGIYRGGSFYLRNSNTLGFADLVFAFGQPGDQPIAGDWDGDGKDTIGVYRSSTGKFLLRDSNSIGVADYSFYLGNVGDVGIAGDWDGDGKDTTGVFRPSNGVIFLKNTNVSGFADVALNYGLPGDQPVTGDWNNDGKDTIGVYRNGVFYLRNSNTIGFADLVFGLGNPGDMPIAGDWDNRP
jgi:photosystem II stability/assembly factor-like uncharacterized protein